jgi:hypothetical protein
MTSTTPRTNRIVGIPPMVAKENELGAGRGENALAIGGIGTST